MAHFVFLMHKFLPYSDANVVCVKNILDQLISEGNTVSVICGDSNKSATKRTEKIDEVLVHRVYHITYIEKLMKANRNIKKVFCKSVHFIKTLCLFPIFPNFEISFSKKMEKEFEKIFSKKSIDCVVGVFQPYATMSALKKIKNKHKEIYSIAFNLDVLKGSTIPIFFPRSVYYKLCDRTETKDFQYFDKILISDLGKRYYNDALYGKFPISFFQIPSFRLVNCTNINKKNNGTVKLIYAGYLDKSYRNPDKLIEAIVSLSKDFSIELHFFGSSNMEENMTQFEKKYCGVIFNHGRVTNDVIRKEYLSADILISFGNDIKGVVPSKIFELIGYNKRIIHFSPGENDDAVEFIKDIPNVCIVNENNIEDEIRNFLTKDIEFLSNEELEKRFYKASPKYLVQQMIERGTSCIKSM